MSVGLRCAIRGSRYGTSDRAFAFSCLNVCNPSKRDVCRASATTVSAATPSLRNGASLSVYDSSTSRSHFEAHDLMKRICVSVMPCSKRMSMRSLAIVSRKASFCMRLATLLSIAVTSDSGAAEGAGM